MSGGQRDVLVAGVGMVQFRKPSEGFSYDDLGHEAVVSALADAGVGYETVDLVYAGYVYGDSCCGQRVVYRSGLTGVPVFNVSNNCSTGSTALFLARQAIAGGTADCVLAVGFEQMNPGALGAMYQDRIAPFQAFEDASAALSSFDGPPALRYFGGAGLEHMDRFGTSLADFASVRAKASRHASRNPLAVFRKELSVEEVLNDQVLLPGAMTRSMACPPTSGAAAALLVSREFASRHGLAPAASIVAQAMTTDGPATFSAGDMINLIGFEMVQRAARQVYEAAGIGPDSIRVCELHDCFAQNEVISYEALGLCPVGEASRFIADGDNTYGGGVVTNPSGGLLSKGHPLGATGLAQCYELVNQLRGTAGARQVEGRLHHALQHNIGLGGACVVTLYKKTES
jgi:sterol carrier protein 2